MEIHRRSRRDVHEIHQEEHDEALNARRVTIVGSGKVDMEVDTSRVTDAITEALKGFKLESPSKSEDIRIIEVPKQVFVPQIETKIIEVPVQTIVKEYQVVEVEKPVITEVIKVVEIEKPIIIEKYTEKMPAWAWSLLITQLFAMGGLVYKLLSLLQKGA